MRRSLFKTCPPEWNVRILTLDDFYYFCDRDGVQLHEEHALEQPGLYMVYGGRPHIFIDRELRGEDRIFTSFHEVGHHWLHEPGIQFFLGWKQNVEAEADIVAACAMIPLTVLRHYWPGEICEIYGYSNWLVHWRRKIYDEWQI